jgi:hypothetical protein
MRRRPSKLSKSKIFVRVKTFIDFPIFFIFHCLHSIQIILGGTINALKCGLIELVLLLEFLILFARLCLRSGNSLADCDTLFHSLLPPITEHFSVNFT